MSSGSWRLEQFGEGRQQTIAEVRDPSLKLAGAFVKICVEVRSNVISATVNGRPVKPRHSNSA